MQTSKNDGKTVKPCPRCGSPAGKGNGGAQCQCKKGKNGAPAPCDAPIKKRDKSAAKPQTGSTGGDCGCGSK